MAPAPRSATMRRGDGIARAWSRLPVILSYAPVAATVGTILRIIAKD